MACSSNDLNEPAENRRQLLHSGNDAGDTDDSGDTDLPPDGELPPEYPIAPIDLPYTLTGLVCKDRSCRPLDYLANYSAEMEQEKQQNLPLEEFLADQLERSISVQESSMKVLQIASELVTKGNPETLMDVALYLPEEFFDFTRLRGVSDDSRADLWNERAQQVQGSQAVARSLVEKVGGTFDGSIQLANIVYAKVPAGALDGVIHADGVLGASLLPAVSSAADGVARRLALAWNNDGLQSWGWDGNQGGSPNGGPIKFGVIETGAGNVLNATHASFLESSSTSSAARQKLERIRPTTWDGTTT